MDFMSDPTLIFIGNQELTVNKNITQIVDVTTEYEKPRKFQDFFYQHCRQPDTKVSSSVS